MALGLVGLVAAGAITRRGSRSVEKAHLVEGLSPLDYLLDHSELVQRLSLHVPGVQPPEVNASHFATRTKRVIVRQAPWFLPETRTTIAPGCAADPVYGECVGFLDYHVIPGTNGAIYIDFYKTRSDQRGRGYGTQLIHTLYTKFSTAPWIDWGRVMSDYALKSFQRLQSTPGVPQSRGRDERE